MGTDRTWGPRLLWVNSPENNEIGTVIIGGKERGSVLAAGTCVGQLRIRPGTWGSFGIAGIHGHYTLRDVNDDEVGRITNSMFVGRPACNVIEIDEQASPTLRTLVLAASTAVSYWLQRSGI